MFVGNDITDALDRLRELQAEMDARYAWLRRQRRRKIVRTDPVELIVAVVDEVAYYSATVGKKQDQEEFSRLLRDVVARGRAAGVIVIAATQRPSVDIIPTSLRDLFGYRLAFRCTTEISSDIILGHGWAKAGYDSSKIAPEDLGVGWLRAEGGVPVRIKSALLTDEQIYDLVDYAAWLRTSHKRDQDRVRNVLRTVLRTVRWPDRWSRDDRPGLRERRQGRLDTAPASTAQPAQRSPGWSGGGERRLQRVPAPGHPGGWSPRRRWRCRGSGRPAVPRGRAGPGHRRRRAGSACAGYSWGEIASRLGVTRQAAQQRWGCLGR